MILKQGYLNLSSLGSLFDFEIAITNLGYLHFNKLRSKFCSSRNTCKASLLKLRSLNILQHDRQTSLSGNMLSF
ncbi:unnamed protein product [Rhizophagus irregularis]|nr:unnamed protein product [Rhizophagus irregularis]